jgi:4-hydroxy-4-methyl-2-oxoglutarate aldolase
VFRLTPEQLEALRRIDSPTIANAIEHFEVRPRVDGFASYEIRCAFPELGTMLGYAVTCTADSTSEERRERGLWALWEALEAAPKPAVLVIKDVGRERDRSCHMGEVMATTAWALGAVGCVTDGGLRDVNEVRALGAFHYFCAGFVVSHGNPVICQLNVPVNVGGLQVKPGDLLHGDVNGVLVIPDGIAARVPEQAERVRQAERRVLDMVRAPGFSVAKLRAFSEQFRH